MGAAAGCGGGHDHEEQHEGVIRVRISYVLIKMYSPGQEENFCIELHNLKK